MSGFFGGGGSGGLGAWAADLQPASFRGIEFAVKVDQIKAGRRTVVHEYPYRDGVYVEDLGRGTTSFAFSGFLVGDDVFAQRDAMLDACDVPGAGLLVHPSVGAILATNVSISAGERSDLGRVVELDLMFIRGDNLTLFPVLNAATQLLTDLRQAAMFVAATARFVTRVITAIRTGNFGAVIGLAGTIAAGLGLGAGASVVAQFGAGIISVLADARMVYGAVSGLTGVFGRFATGGHTAAQPDTATASSLLIDQTAHNAATMAAVTAAQTAMDTDPINAAPSVAAMMTTLVAAIGSPADQIRLLAEIAQTPITLSPDPNLAATQAAVADLCAQAALAQLAKATTIYEPTSYNDAIAVRRLVCGLLGTGAIHCADTGDTGTYLAMKALQAAVASDLTVRGAQLPALVTVTRARPTASLKLAYDLYGDATRADDLIARVNPPNPAFFPTSFVALAS